MPFFTSTNKLTDSEFKRLTGVKRSSFNLILDILNIEFNNIHKKNKGRLPKLSMEDRLMLILEYYREYRTMFHIGVSFGISKSSVSKTITWIEETLTKSKKFALPKKEELMNKKFDFEVFLIDATENQIERPKKKLQKPKKRTKKILLKKEKKAQF